MTLIEILNKGGYLTFIKKLVNDGLITTLSNGDPAVSVAEIDGAETALPAPSTNIGVLTHTGSAQSTAIPTWATALVISGATNASDILFGSTQAEAETVTVGTGIPIKAAADKDSIKVPSGATHLGYIGTNLETMQYYWS